MVIEEMSSDSPGDRFARADYEHLISLFEHATANSASHWNPNTGEVFSVRSKRRARSRIEAFEERLFEETGWLEIPYQESDRAHAMLCAFATDLSPGAVRAVLLQALDGDKPFRTFRATISRHHGLQRRLRAWKRAEAEQRMVLFCLGRGLELDHQSFSTQADQLREELEGELPSEASLDAVRVAVEALSMTSRAGREDSAGG